MHHMNAWCQGGQSGLNLLELELKISYHVDSGNSTAIQVLIIEPSLQPHYFSVLKVLMVEVFNFLCWVYSKDLKFETGSLCSPGGEPATLPM